MPNIFESIGKGVGDIAGGVVKGAGDIFNAIPAVRASNTSSDLREVQIINNAANMLINTPEEQQGDILAALTRIGLSKEAIGAAQQVAQSGKPLSDEEVKKALGGFGESGFGAQAGFTRKGTEFQVATPTGKTKVPGKFTATVQTERLQRNLDQINDDIKTRQKAMSDGTLDKKEGDKEIQSLVTKRKAAELAVDRERAKQTGLVEQTSEEVLEPAQFSRVGFIEGALSPSKQRGDVSFKPRKTKTTTSFAAPNIATPKTAPTLTTPKQMPTAQVISPHSALTRVWSQLDSATQQAISDAIKKQKPKDRAAWIKKLKKELKASGRIK